MISPNIIQITPVNTTNRYLIKNEYALNNADISLIFIKFIFISLLNLITFKTISMTSALSNLYWKELKSKRKEFQGVFDETFFKTNQFIQGGNLFDKKQLSKDLKNNIEYISTFCHVNPNTLNYVTDEERKIIGAVNAPKDIIEHIMTFVEKDDPIAKKLQTIQESDLYQNLHEKPFQRSIILQDSICEAIRTGNYRIIDQRFNDDKKMALFVIKNLFRYGSIRLIYSQCHDGAKKLLTDKDFVLKAIAEGAQILPVLSDEFKEDETIIKEYILRNGGGSLYHAGPKSKTNKKLVLFALEHFEKEGNFNKVFLHMLSPQLQADRDVVMAAVKINGKQIEYASPVLRGDEEIMKQAVLATPEALKFASDKIKDDKDFILKAIRKSRDSKSDLNKFMKYVSPKLQDDVDFVTEAMDISNDSFQYASERIRGMKSIAMKAINVCGFHWGFVSKELKEDFDVALAAVTTYGTSYLWLPDSLKANKEIIMAVIKSSGKNHTKYSFTQYSPLRNIPTHLLDKELILEAVKQHRDAYYCLKDLFLEKKIDVDYCNEKEILLLVLTNHSEFFEIPKKFCGDLEVMKAAIKSNPSLIATASDEIRLNKEIILEAISYVKFGTSLSSLHFIIPPEYYNDRDIFLEVTKKHDSILAIASTRLKNDPELLKLAQNTRHRMMAKKLAEEGRL
ncbi:MAG: DUF4116 domain-containing protein [Parachlamydiaceae bacterium]|nr:DUF4116 domain-containing protein [Parachlamydiaceae bacterium]